MPPRDPAGVLHQSSRDRHQAVKSGAVAVLKTSPQGDEHEYFQELRYPLALSALAAAALSGAHAAISIRTGVLVAPVAVAPVTPIVVASMVAAPVHGPLPRRAETP